jgi:hypothetical protein
MLNQKMKTFDIYKKREGFYWTNTMIVYSTLILSLIILYLKKEVFGFEKNFLDAIFVTTAIASLVYGLVMKLSGLARYEPLKGKLNELLKLELESVAIGSEVFFINDIKKIEINNFDYEGHFKYTSRGSFEANLSQGIGNSMIITLNSGEKKGCQFRQQYADDMCDAKSELINYYKKGKIHFLHLIDILKIADYDEIQEFKKEIQ